MQKRPLHSQSVASITVEDLDAYGQGWILDSEMRQLSPQTLTSRKIVVEKLLWFLRDQERPQCGVNEIRGFLAHLSRGHESPNGRWGNPANRKPVKPVTVQTYFINLKTLFRFFIAEGILEESPVEKLKAPVVRRDQVQPFTDAQVEQLLAAAKQTRHPRRDELIVLFLLDTGMRVSELCGLTRAALDLSGRRCTVLGKGNKTRTVFYGIKTSRALWAYLREEEREGEVPLFTADAGRKPGERMTRSGVQQLIERLGEKASIERVRCSPHTFRHTFAVSFLRNGGNVFTLKELLGHTTLAMVNRYLALAQADLEAQHRQFSPADRMKKGNQ